MKNRLLSIAVGRSLLERFARETGWLKRSAKVLTPSIFIQALVAAVAGGQRSLRELAIEVGLLAGRTISKQALTERIDAGAVEFVRRACAEALRRAACSVPALGAACKLPGITRILVGDSSTLSLHPSLAEHFPGATNQTDKKSAQLRLQLTFDLLGGRWLQAALDPYRRNDKSAAMDIVGTIVRAGDLIIRDLGYATVGCFAAIAERGAFFLSRLQPAISVFGEGGEKLDILGLARRRAPLPGDTFSKRVLLGADGRFACRLVIIRAPEKVGAERRRRLRLDAKRRGVKPHREAYMDLQDWTIFVTNLSEDQAGDDQLHQLYQLRWRIENIFKLSKSHTDLLKVAGHRTNKHHAQVLIWAWLLMMITLSGQGLFRLYDPSAGAGGEQALVEVSIFKSIGRILAWVALSIELSFAGDLSELMERLMGQLSYHDRYEKRSRISMPQRFAMALQLEDEPSDYTLRGDALTC